MGGADTEMLQVPDGGTVADVIALIRAREAWTPVAALPLSFAVNECIVAEDYRLADGDRLALLAPVSGG